MEDKQHQISLGFAQNKSSYETNKKKRKRNDDDFNYLYGIVTTELTDDALKTNSSEYQILRDNVKCVLELGSRCGFIIFFEYVKIKENLNNNILKFFK